MPLNSSYRNLTRATIWGFLAFRIFFIATTDYNLIADEAYFWDWSRHPAPGYYDMGPMVAWIIWIFTALLPLSEFSVRLGAPVLAALTALLVRRLATAITPTERHVFWVVLIFHVTPMATAQSIIMTYYAPQVFFWALTTWFTWRLVETGQPRWWYLMGVSAGLGLLSHHMFVFFSAQIGLFILLSPQQRFWLRTKTPYVAILIALVVASPLIIWNLTHQLVMARHAMGLMDNAARFVEVFLDYVGKQAGVQTPLFFLAVLYSLAVAGHRGLKGRDDRFLFLLCLAAPLLIFIGLLALGGRTEANWPTTAYITATIATVIILIEKYDAARKIKRNLLKAGAVFTVAFGLAALVFACYPGVLRNRLGIDLPPRIDPSNRLYGWRELGDAVSQVLADMPAGTFVSSKGYGKCAQLAFYVQGRPQIYAMPVERRHHQYDFWNDAIETIGRDAVFADRSPMSDAVKARFKKVVLARHLVIRVKGSDLVRTQFYVYRCFEYKGAPSAQIKNF